jgi:hypothetical protein
MSVRSITVNGKTWQVSPSGLVTQYDRDEFGLVFVHEADGQREVRVTRYSPRGARSRAQSFSELSDSDLDRLMRESQPSFTSPEAGYAP